MFTTQTVYPKSRNAGFDPLIFRDPPSEYRGAPFWSWNNRLSIPQLVRQIHQMKSMGFGGFYMHPRTGLGTEYMGDEYMAAVRACVDEAKAEGMLALLYDEDRWPSGYAGGLVTRDDYEFRGKQLLWTCAPRDTKQGMLLGVYDVRLDEDGYLASYDQAAPGTESTDGGKLWFAYLTTHDPITWFNGATYVDTLNPAAIRRFLDVTHERYAAAFGQEFGKTIPTIFTDEPQFSGKQTFRTPWDTQDILLPFTGDLFDTYARTYGQRLEEHLPELFWELPEGRSSTARYRYHDHVCERFTEAFADQVGAWCEAHGIALTGHMMEESTLRSQTNALSEAMRSYRSFQLPGIDILCDSHEYNTAKQAQSAAHQYGRSGVMSELYGVTNWDYPFSGHKSQGDWQAALGITARVPHLTWVSMQGEAKRDYPASIGYQSPWFKEYPLIEDHFARVGSVLTLGEPVVRVGVIHPVESYWLASGPSEQTSLACEELETDFTNLTHWLLYGLIDFDFIAESLLPELCPDMDPIDSKFPVGKMHYDVVIVPNLRTMRASTLSRLDRFAATCGRVILLGEAPSLIDATPSDAAREAARRWQPVPFTRPRIIEALSGLREIEARMPSGDQASSLLHQIRQVADSRYVFVCNADRKSAAAMATETEWLTQFRLFGSWSVRELETFSGEQSRVPSSVLHRGDRTWTEIRRSLPPHGSLLLELTPRDKTEPNDLAPPPAEWREIARLADPVPVTLSEPNVLILDRAEYRFDNAGEWHGLEEILRIGRLYRRQHGLSVAGGGEVQPWADTDPAPVVGEIALRFTVVSEIEVAAPSIALEIEPGIRLSVNGADVATGPDASTGYFIDEAIRVVPSPAISKGVNTIELAMPFTRKSNLEVCYLLGDFGVAVAGSHARITEPVRTLAWGDWTRQGLPFYAGNVTYHVSIGPIAEENDRIALHAPHFAAPLLSVSSQLGEIGKIAFAPYRLDLTGPVKAPGNKLALDITAFGTRINTVGMVHNCIPGPQWYGPDAWRTDGAGWSEEYQLRPAGVLVAPMIERSTEEH